VKDRILSWLPSQPRKLWAGSDTSIVPPLSCIMKALRGRHAPMMSSVRRSSDEGSVDTRRAEELTLVTQRASPQRDIEDKSNGGRAAGGDECSWALHRSRDTHSDANSKRNGIERCNAGSAKWDTKGPSQRRLRTAELNRGSKFESSGSGREKVINAHDGVEIEAKEQRDEHELEGDGCDGRVRQRRSRGEEGGREAHFCHPKQLERVLEELRCVEAPVGQRGRG